MPFTPPRRVDSWLLIDLVEEHDVVSWAIVGGGRRRTRTIAWLQVRAEDLSPDVDARDFLRQRLVQIERPTPVGLMTGCNLDTYVEKQTRFESTAVRCVVTVGLDNALRAGDPPGPFVPAGTINLLCQTSFPLTEEASFEALALAAEARAGALVGLDVRSRRTNLPATGTGTDCVVVAAPRGGVPVEYVGKHTAAGWLIGATVAEAVHEGVVRWCPGPESLEGEQR
jgi:adenosylcobinamide amidohydrolase